MPYAAYGVAYCWQNSLVYFRVKYVDELRTRFREKLSRHNARVRNYWLNRSDAKASLHRLGLKSLGFTKRHHSFLLSDRDFIDTVSLLLKIVVARSSAHERVPCSCCSVKQKQKRIFLMSSRNADQTYIYGPHLWYACKISFFEANVSLCAYVYYSYTVVFRHYQWLSDLQHRHW